ncbi:MAG: hypothetical protein ACREON_15250 [Gemmatimonadaceae bacterium]
MPQAALGQTRSEGGFQFGLAAGPTILRGDLAEGADVGYHLLGFVRYAPSAVPVAIRVDLIYARVDLENTTLPDGRLTGDGFGRVIAPLVSAVFTLDRHAAVSPYVLIGVGLYGAHFSVGQPLGDGVRQTELLEETRYGLNGGVGASMRLGRVRAFLEARLHLAKPAGTKVNIVPLSIGIAL